MIKNVYEEIIKFKNKYKFTIGWRLEKHAKVIQTHINPDEKILYAFYGQRGQISYDIFSTCVVCLTDKRILVGQKKLLWGYYYNSITPDLFNDLNVRSRLIWGMVTIDTIEEKVYISNLDKRSLPEIETKISTYMIEEKQKYARRNK